MKKYALACCVIVTALSVFMFCGDNGSNPDDDPVVIDKTIFGMWRDTILNQSTMINLHIHKNDSTFLISVLNTTDSLLRQTGVWEIAADSIYLHGREGAIIDTVSKTLVPLPDSLAQKTTVLDTTRDENNIWHISGQSLAPVIDNFPIDDNLKPFIKSIQFTFTKDIDTIPVFDTTGFACTR